MEKDEKLTAAQARKISDYTETIDHVYGTIRDRCKRGFDFTWVDKMEKIKVAPKVSKTFLTQGEVKPTEGGAK